MADEQAKKGPAANQVDVRHNYDSSVNSIRRATRGAEVSNERISPGEWHERRKALPQRIIKVVKEGADNGGSSEKRTAPGPQVQAA